MVSRSSYWDYIPLFDTFNEAIIIYDSEKIHWVNEALVTLLGYDNRDEIMGKNIVSFIENDSKQEATHQLKRLCMGVKRTGGVYNVTKKDNSSISVVSRGTQLPASDDLLLVSIIRPVEEDPVDKGLLWSDFRFKHEISSSLTILRGYVELLEEKASIPGDDEVCKWFDCVFEQIERIGNVLGELR